MTDAAQLPATAPKRAPAVAQAAQHAPMPTAIALYLDDALYERVSSIASRMSKAQGVTPKHLIAAPEACFAVVSRAITWRLDPFAVAMATYQTPGGQIGFEGKLVHAIIENSGRLDPAGGGIRYEHYGDWSKVQGKFAIRESPKQDSEGKAKKYAAATWTDEDARAGKPTDQAKYPVAQSCGVRVIAHVRGETEPRMLDFDLIQAQPRNSTLWATDPMTQICYTAVRRFGSLVASALLMGVPFDPVDHFQPGEPIDVTEPDPGPIGMPSAKGEEQAATDKPAPLDVDLATGETSAPAGKTDTGPVTPAGDATASNVNQGGTAGTPARDAAETGQGGTQAEPPDIKKMPRASPTQRETVAKVAKASGFTPAQFDDVLIGAYGVGIDELPMQMVAKAIELAKKSKPPA